MALRSRKTRLDERRSKLRSTNLGPRYCSLVFNSTLEEKLIKRTLTILLCVLFCLPACMQAADKPQWSIPIEPFRIADNLYYVGSKDLASYLIVTPKGDILINSNLQSWPPLIKKSVEQLGFHFTDVKILLISHSHFDHDAGSAEIKRQTGAQYMVMDGDVPVVESGGAKDFQYPKDLYPAAKVDRVLRRRGTPVDAQRGPCAW